MTAFSLASIDASAWRELGNAASDQQSGFRYINLCSVDASGRPQARMVVLRRTDIAGRSLEIHSDVRSHKWAEISTHPHVTVLGYCADSRVQLRLQGTAILQGPGSALADQAWSQLSARKRSTYGGGPPGDELVNDTQAPDSPAKHADGKAIFGAITFHTQFLDWCKLGQADIQRAFFTYDDIGTLVDSRWINP